MGLILIQPASALPVGVIDARSHLRVDDGNEDDVIYRLIETATAALDGRDGLLGRALVASTWRLDLDSFCPVIKLPLPPCQAVTSITYLDSAGTEQFLLSSAYVLRGAGDPDGATLHPSPGTTWPATWAMPGAVSITFRAGYGGAAENVPVPIRQAILAHVATLYGQRESTVITTGHVEDFASAALDLLTPFRVRGFGA